jgi:hypothetical protein
MLAPVLQLHRRISDIKSRGRQGRRGRRPSTPVGALEESAASPARTADRESLFGTDRGSGGIDEKNVRRASWHPGRT